MSFLEAGDRPVVVLVAEIGTARGGSALASALAVAASLRATDAREPRSALVADLTPSPRRSRTLLASAPARELEASLRSEGNGLASAAARGYVCHLALPGEAESFDLLAESCWHVPAKALCVHIPGSLWLSALEHPHLRPDAGLLRSDLPAQRSVAALAVSELRRRGLRARIAGRPLGVIAARRAFAGVEPGGSSSRRLARLARGLLGETGQAIVVAMAAVTAVLVSALVLAAVGGAVTGKGRAQRAADLAAISAARSMRDDFPRLFSPPVLANGIPNPYHLDRVRYLLRARVAAYSAAHHNDVAPWRLRIGFPDGFSFAPVRVRATVSGSPSLSATAVAEAAFPGSFTGLGGFATGGGYSGRLAYRQGKPMRPDVALAFDQMAAAARGAGLSLLVSSGFRSDAEQAQLFAAHPDPTWVAPPGHSLHRCATELDLGPSSAYGWLAANAGRFGFLRRYSWEAWHFGFVRGPPPCSAAGNRVTGSGDGRAQSFGGLPAFVPARFRAPIGKAAARWNVSAALLAAQLFAESNFNPYAVSPAGAQGIAQFIPSTAHAYGLANPFNATAAIGAQAHLMADLLHQFGSVPLALAAYNAGPGAVSGCHCVPPYAETRAYVARILGLLHGAGDLLTPPLEVRLVS